MGDYSHNLISERYKRCGYGKPYYNQDGHYEEVFCELSKEFCGECPCPVRGEQDNER